MGSDLEKVSTPEYGEDQVMLGVGGIYGTGFNAPLVVLQSVAATE